MAIRVVQRCPMCGEMPVPCGSDACTRCRPEPTWWVVSAVRRLGAVAATAVVVVSTSVASAVRLR